LAGNTPTIVKLGEKALKYFQSGSHIFPERNINRDTKKDTYLARRGLFFMQQAMDMGFNKVDLSLLDRYVQERDQDLKRHLGMMVISAYLDKATKPILPAYKSSLRMGLIPENHPTTPVKFIKHISVSGEIDYRTDYLTSITKLAKKRLAV
jgi:hypothetical protein